MSAPPGMIGLTQISGRVGKGIAIAQFLNGNGFSRWEHAFVTLPTGEILEAEPGGAVIRPLHYAARDIHWCEGIYQERLPVSVRTGLPYCQDRMIEVAQQLEGTPYSFLDYGALALHRLHVPAPHLRAFIADSGHEICSQLADDFYLRLGAHIFDDGRWPGYATPGALYQRDLELTAKKLALKN